MTVQKLIDTLGLEILHLENGEREISGGYTGDLLSWVMGCVGAGEAWITIMNNLNVIAVAVLREVGAVILAENAEVGEEVLFKAKEEKINLLRSPKGAFLLCAQIAAELEK